MSHLPAGHTRSAILFERLPLTKGNTHTEKRPRWAGLHPFDELAAHEARDRGYLIDEVSFGEQHRTSGQEPDLVTQASPASGRVVWIETRGGEENEIGVHFGGEIDDL